MCTITEQVPPRSAADALSMMGTAIDYLNAADVHALGTSGQREVLAAVEVITAKTSAFRAAALAAFDAAGGPEAEGCKNLAAWLAHRGGMTRAAARKGAKSTRVSKEHPLVAGAQASGDISGSFGELICGLTGKLPDQLRGEADGILITAAIGGCGEHELKLIASRIWEEYKSGQPDPDEDDPFTDRGLTLDETLDGAGRLRGDLTPQCTAALRAVLDSLGKHRGADDSRTVAQRQHDALAEALEMLLAAGGLPQRHGTPTRAEVLIGFADLRQMPGASALEEAWLHNHTPGAPVYLTGTAAEGAACDATLIPVVTGSPDWAVADQIIELVLKHKGTREELRYQVGTLALDFVSGPAGIAATLRRGLLDGPFIAPSLPLDIGCSDTIPGWLRTAVVARDRHCQWPGGCDAPPARCDVHHIVPKSRGGTTSLANLGLFCKFHHLIAIHAWGWTLTMQAGVMKVTSPDGNTTYTSRAPPTAKAA